MSLKLIFKDYKSFEDREAESQHIKRMYPNCVPIIVEKGRNTSLPELDKKKFIVQKKQKMQTFFYLLRKKFKLAETQRIYLIVKGISPNLETIIEDIYQVNHLWGYFLLDIILIYIFSPQFPIVGLQNKL